MVFVTERQCKTHNNSPIRQNSAPKKIQFEKDMPSYKKKHEEVIPEYSVAVFGDGQVGKTCMIRRFVFDLYNDHYEPTVSDVYKTSLSCKDKTVANLTIYDTSGSINFPVMDRLTIAKATACVVAFSVTSKSSLEYASRILKQIISVKCETKCPCVVVGCKNDVERIKREITFEQGVQFAVAYGCSYLEVSSTKGANINEIFEMLFKKIKYLELMHKDKVSKSSSLRARALSIKSIFV